MAVESRAGKQISYVGGRPDEKHLTLPRPVCSRSLRPASGSVSARRRRCVLQVAAGKRNLYLVRDTSAGYRPSLPLPLHRHSLVMSRYILFTLLLLVSVGLGTSSFLEFVWRKYNENNKLFVADNFKDHQVKKVSGGGEEKLKKPVAAPCNCSKEEEPVCGTDGTTEYTYLNPCILHCNKQLIPELKVAYQGHCCEMAHCPAFGRPVCDHRGQLHQNNCFFEHAQCIELRRNGHHLAMDMSSPKCQCNHTCSNVWEPVCDSDGMTHSNLCEFLNAKCFAQIKFGINLTVDYVGACCDSLCQSKLQPYFVVCDSDGRSHRDMCAFYVHQCREERKTGRRPMIARFGLCQPPTTA